MDSYQREVCGYALESKMVTSHGTNMTLQEAVDKILDQQESEAKERKKRRFPNLGSDDVIIPGMASLSFNIELTSTADPNRTLVSNIGRAIIKKLAVKFERNEILSIDNYDVFACY